MYDEMRRLVLILTSFVALLIPVSCDVLEVVAPENYLDTFELEPYSWGEFEMVRVRALHSISKDEVMDVLVGNGWETVSVFRLDKDKNLAEVDEIVESCFLVRKQDELVQYGLDMGRYEELPFAYNDEDNSISLSPSFYTGGHMGGKIVHMTDNIMVCVSSNGLPDYQGRPMIYMEIFHKVSRKTLKDWKEKCPKPGLWI